MKTKEMKISVPKGYVIDKENSTLECIKFKLDLDYEKIADSLFKDGHKYINYSGIIKDYSGGLQSYNTIIGTSDKHIEKMIAISKITNVAKYLNEGWKPDWNDRITIKWYIVIDNNKVGVGHTIIHNSSIAYFMSQDLVYKAIDILGENTIRLALSMDW